MPVTVKVNGPDLAVVHKGTPGRAMNTIPDVCKTPSPGGPVPIPYPKIISFSKDLANGTTSVKADGGNMIAIKGSEFSRCMGDEAGTAGGVKSSTNMKEAAWILYSFDVKLDGKNACRKSDKMTMNHGNTVCLSGEDDLDVKVEAIDTCAKCGKPQKGTDPKPQEVSRVYEDGKPKYQLASGEEGLSVFGGMSADAVMGAASWRPGSKVETKSVADIEAQGLTVVQTHGDCDFLNGEAQDKHWEIQPSPGDSRNDFKKKLTTL